MTDKEQLLDSAIRRMPNVKQWFWTGTRWFPACLAAPFGNHDKWYEDNKLNIHQVKDINNG